MSITKPSPAIANLPVRKVRPAGQQDLLDQVAVEEPLEIRAITERQDNGTGPRTLSVTMRTPGNDAELAAGWLLAEGIIADAAQLLRLDQSPEDPNSITAILDPKVSLEQGHWQRHSYTNSSCGVCGKTSIEALGIPPSSPAGQFIDQEDPGAGSLSGASSWQVPARLLYQLPARLREEQDIFDSTGGLHAAGLFDREGALLLLREDIGRHNALDKLIGAALIRGMLPLHEQILLLSGRACFELIQKAAIAGIRLIAAVGPPSSMAVTTAAGMDMTLIGFLRDERYNIYTGAQRINLQL